LTVLRKSFFEQCLKDDLKDGFCEEYWDFDGSLILVDTVTKKSIGRILCMPRTEEGKVFVGVILKDHIKIIEDVNTENGDKS